MKAPKSDADQSQIAGNRRARLPGKRVRSEQSYAPCRPGGRLDVILLLLFIAGAYIDFEIALSGDLQLPSPIAFASGCILLARRAVHVSRLTVPYFAGLTVLLSILLLWNLLFSPYFSVENVRGSIQFLFSVFACTGFFFGLISISRSLFMKILWWLLVFLVCISVLEIYTPLRTISDAFRQAVYEDMAVYAADARDLTRYGALRPKAFAREPSFVGQFYTMLATAWLVLRADRFGQAFLLGGCATFIGLFIIRSPIVGAIIPLMGCYIIVRKNLVTANRREGNSKSLILMMIAIFSIFLVVGFITAFAEYGFLDASIFQRVVAPVYALQAILGRAPLLGSGLGVEEAVSTDLAATLLRLPVVRYIDTGSLRETSYLFLNSFFGIWIALGLLGGLILFVILERFLTKAKVANTFFVLLCSFIVMNSTGGATTIKAWLFFFMIAAVVRQVETARLNGTRRSRSADLKSLKPTTIRQHAEVF